MISVYITDVTGVDLSDCRFFSLMSDYRRKKLEKIYNDRVKKLSVGAEVMLCYAFKRISPNICLPPYIRVSPAGKPYTDNIYFSLSHSKEFAACAVSQSNIGLDIEKIMPNPRLETGRKFLTQDEQELLTKDNFYEFWTKKESFLKLYGFNRLPDFTSFTVTEEKSESETLPYAYFSIFQRRGYCISTASEKNDTAEIFEVNFNEAVNYILS